VVIGDDVGIMRIAARPFDRDFDRFEDEVADGQDQPVVIDDHARAGPPGSEAVGSACLIGDDGFDLYNGRKAIGTLIGTEKRRGEAD